MPHSGFLAHYTNLDDLTDVFRMLFDDNQIGVTIVTPDGTIVYYNDAQARLDGLEPKDALGRVICDVYNFTPDDSPTMRTLRTGKPIIDGVHYYRTRHGKLVNSSNAIYPLWSKGVLLGAICCIQNYTTIDMQMQNAAVAAQKEESRAAKSPKAQYTFSSLIGKSKALMDAVSLARQAARNPSSVMLVGETGVGKEIFAQAIHYEGPRRDFPYTAVNCSAVPETLLEGILFGTTKGAFTGAVNRAGLFEVTNKGTLYLDEVDSMPVSLQSKLLRVLQEKRVRRIGEAHERDIDVRIISSVRRNPTDLINEGLLRPDFYYRLGVVRVLLPTLRSRMEDLHLLVRHFIRKHSATLGLPTPLITPEAMAILYAHSWPGNVRELEHAIEAGLTVLEPGLNLEPVHLCRACPDICPDDRQDESTTPWLAYQDQARKRAAAEAPAAWRKKRETGERNGVEEGEKQEGAGTEGDSCHSSGSGGIPHGGGSALTSDGRLPADGEGMPVGGGASPIGGGTTPIGGGTTPIGGKRAPTGGKDVLFGEAGGSGSGADGSVGEAKDSAHSARLLSVNEDTAEGNATPTSPEARAGLLQTTRDMEAQLIKKALKSAAGSTSLAARLLGLSPQLLHYKLKKYGINRSEYTPKTF